ncbi:FAD:protein FMN transferase [BD1-7 clade bacterium]|uniref:FAD:protein FMN transferase n=1 Tax=BD1-7 clade bacterium TaxID=2029982 RepID=A0A5S9NMT3_9GAMM|nr:FAD:protein FMN transferase [BD1-7 clade bacterium]CAA0094206.1 FAD:protein FMN transferase [BD1-7 clade bacterium]
MKTYCSMISAANVRSFKQLLKASLIIQVSLLFLLGCGSSNKYVNISGATMGTTYHVTAELLKGASQVQIQAAIDRRLREINQSMSTYIDTSKISEFNRLPVGQSLPIDDDFVDVFQVSRKIYDMSNGAFNPSVGALVDLWGFGPEYRMQDTAKIPSDADIAKARAEMGFADIMLDGNVLTKRTPVHLDFSAVAKGYAVDEIAEVLNQFGITNFMVEIGGEVSTRGNSPRGDYWRIAIEAPDKVREKYPTTLNLHEASIATSGDYRNYYEVDGQRYTHIIDPVSGRPVTHGLTSVTVIADDVAQADAWATALLVLGEDAGFQLAKDVGLAIYMIYHTDGGLDAKYTEAMKDYLLIKE